MSKSKKILIAVIAVLAVAAAVLAVTNRNAQKEAGSGLVLRAAGEEKTVAWESVKAGAFTGELVNGKGEVSSHDYEGIELKALLEAQGIAVSAEDTVTATSEDNYSAELTGSEILEDGKVYVAVTQDGEKIEGIEGGGQGAQLIVFGDPNSKRAVRYLKYIECGK